MKTIGLRTLVEELNLKNLTPDVDMDDVRIATPDINRPALQLTGYYEHFANERVQIIGYVEFSYLQHLEEEVRVKMFEDFVSRKIPCVIFTTNMQPGQEILSLCEKYQVPALGDIFFYGGDYPVAGRKARADDFHPRCAGGCFW